VIATVSAGTYAVAWTDGGDGTPDVVLRTVDVGSGTLGPVRVAHEARGGTQQDPDIVRVNGEWIVAWSDLFDVHVRRFSSALTPLGVEESVPQAAGLQSGVSLAEVAGTWALAWRANDAGLESIRVVSGSDSWSTESRLPGPAGDRPALTAFPGGDLLVVFSAGGGAADAGPSATSELRAAVLERTATGTVDSDLLPLAPAGLPASRPRIARIDDRIALAWQSEDEVSALSTTMMGEVVGPWGGASVIGMGTVAQLATMNGVDDRSNPVIAPSPRGAFIGAWENWAPFPGRPVPDVAYVFRGFLVEAASDER
jgi:hypothetical protein